MTTSQDKSLEWRKHRPAIHNFKQGINQCHSVLMGDYLIALVDDKCNENSFKNWRDKPSDQQLTALFAIDLRDNSVQEAEIKGDLFLFHEGFTFHKYKDNQIIKIGGKVKRTNIKQIDWITIESFKRIHSIISRSNPRVKPLLSAAKKYH